MHAVHHEGSGSDDSVVMTWRATRQPCPRRVSQPTSRRSRACARQCSSQVCRTLGSAGRRASTSYLEVQVARQVPAPPRRLQQQLLRVVAAGVAVLRDKIVQRSARRGGGHAPLRQRGGDARRAPPLRVPLVRRQRAHECRVIKQPQLLQP